MKLIIAEKPSVGQAIGKALHITSRKDGYLEGKDYLISWCMGHLLTTAYPDVYGEQYAQWKLETLPIVPQKWIYIPPSEERKRKQYETLKKLLEDTRIEGVICATDAGREGELIFRHLYNYCGCTKPIQRLWISSMEEEAIQEGFAKLKDGKEYDSLYQAALCREKADWLVGLNATRLFSIVYDHPLNVGRVVTPTLAMIYDYFCGWMAENLWYFDTKNRHDVEDGSNVICKNCYGRIEGNIAWVITSRFEKTIQEGGFDISKTIKEFAERGILIKGTRNSVTKRINKVVVRCYQIKLAE